MTELNETTNLDIRDILWKVRRYRWILALTMVLALCGAIVYVKITVPQYQSSVLVSLGERAQVSQALQPLVQPERTQENPREKMAVLDNRLHSRAFLTELAHRTGMLRDPVLLEKGKEAARRWPGMTPVEYATRVSILTLDKKIQVVPVEGSYIRIAATDSDPQKARNLANAIADLLIEENKRLALERVQARGDFSEDQIRVQEEKLRKAENDYRAYQESIVGRRLMDNPVNDTNVESARLLLQQVDEETEQIRDRLGAANQEYRRVAGSDRALPELRSSRSAELEARLSDLEVSYGIAMLRAEAGRSESQELSSKIAGVRQALLAEYESQASSLGGQTSPAAREVLAGIALDQSILRSLRDKRARIVGMIQDYARGIRSSPREEMELQRLKMEVDNNRELLLTLRRESTSSRISEALEVSSLGLRLDIVEAPQLPILPVWPKPGMILGGALLFAPLAAIALIFGIERMSATLSSVEQAEAELGLRVIGTIPKVEGWARPGNFVQRNLAPLVLGLVLLLTASFFMLQASGVIKTPGRPPLAGTSR